LWAKKHYGIKRVTFYDEVFTSDRGWLKEFLIEYKKKINLPFFCCVHPSGVDEDSVKLLSSAGCTAVNMGIQTVNRETRRKVLGRNESNEQISKVLNLLSKTNIFVYTNIMLGIPGQDEEELLENLRFCNIYKADLPAIYWLRYYPKTRIIQIARRASLITDREIEKIENSYEYNPYAIKGNTYTKSAAKIGNLILISGLIPKSIMNFIIKYRLYRFMPTKNMLFPVIFSMGVLKKIIQRKHEPFHYFSPLDYLRYYIFYMEKILFLNFGKKE
jgi:radical SAM superfamily enzyme YgiQ (UPF0313 family)